MTAIELVCAADTHVACAARITEQLRNESVVRYNDVYTLIRHLRQACAAAQALEQRVLGIPAPKHGD